jgi:GNAT superfamily N-acetyltransferase
VNIRKATLKDIETLIQARIDYLNDETNSHDNFDTDGLRSKLREYFNKWIPSNGLVAFVAEEADEICATAFLSIIERIPKKAASANLVGIVYNVYTYPRYRKKGIATKVMSALLEEAKALGLACIDLLATDAGKPLYEKLGFGRITDYTSMRKMI